MHKMYGFGPVFCHFHCATSIYISAAKLQIYYTLYLLEVYLRDYTYSCTCCISCITYTYKFCLYSFTCKSCLLISAWLYLHVSKIFKHCSDSEYCFIFTTLWQNQQKAQLKTQQYKLLSELYIGVYYGTYKAIKISKNSV